jgi:hypothetical protein
MWIVEASVEPARRQSLAGRRPPRTGGLLMALRIDRIGFSPLGLLRDWQARARSNMSSAIAESGLARRVP